MLPDSEKPTTKLKRASNRPTLLGIPAMKDAVSECLPMKYSCMLTTKTGMLFSAKIITHLSLEEYLDWKNWDLFELTCDPDIALPGERTIIEE